MKTEFDRVIFTQAVIDQAARDKIMSLGSVYLGQPFGIIKAHHMTINYRPTIDEYNSLNYGDKTTIYAVGAVGDNNCQAILIETTLPVANKHPHITLSHTLDVTPKYSNELIENGKMMMFGEAIPLVATIGWSDGQEDKYYKILTDIDNDIPVIKSGLSLENPGQKIVTL